MNENIDNLKILSSIKKLIGITDECTAFDKDIVIHINTAFAALVQIGIGPSEGFRIGFDGSEEWSDFLGVDNKQQQSVIDYVYLKTKTLFDPSANGTIKQAYDESLKEIEWRLSISVSNQKEQNNE